MTAELIVEPKHINGVAAGQGRMILFETFISVLGKTVERELARGKT